VADLSRIDKHITLVAVFHIVYHALGLLVGLVIFSVLALIGRLTDDPVAATILAWIGTFIGTFFIVLSVPGVIGGFWLLRRREWARILTLIVAALGLIDIPLGTALGVYTFWVLIQDEAVDEFRKRPEGSDVAGEESP
jgi:hypothetical protein